MARWSVDLIRGKKPEHLGVASARDERVAITKAVEVFGIVPERQNRLAVTKISDRE
jgi:hypothetical protein